MTSSALVVDSLHCKWSFWHGPQRGTGPSDVVQAQCVHIRLGRGQCAAVLMLKGLARSAEECSPSSTPESWAAMARSAQGTSRRGSLPSSCSHRHPHGESTGLCNFRDISKIAFSSISSGKRRVLHSNY